ncbi:WG repeat-containing protein [Clostridium sp.]|uniref:WG repeat-containing protein n=1 Tax=Clostridium sp. TaxID=1506 RepID=UPI002FC689FC
MTSLMYLCNFIEEFIPAGGEVLILDEPCKGPAIIMGDLDGDGRKEVIAAYRYQDEIFLILLKNYCGIWKEEETVRGKGYNITYLGIAPIIKNNSRELIVGWQIGTIWSALSIFQWTDKGLKDLMKENLYFSKIEVGYLGGKKSKSHKAKVALWSHFTGEAYEIQVYSWKDGELVIDPGTYEHYFQRVALYYKEKLKENPELLFYWYFLADAQIKIKNYDEALVSINKALQSPYPFPSKKKLIKIKTELQERISRRSEELYPASLKTIENLRWGYINSQGDLRIKPNFDYAMDFQKNGVAVVGANNLQGIIDANGEYVVKPIYGSIGNFAEERAAVIDDEGFKVIDETGRILTTKAYSFIGTYEDGRALFANNREDGKYLYGYLDREGNEVIPLQFESGTDFKNGRAIVKVKDNVYEMIDVQGNIITTYNYAFVGNMNEELLVFQPIGNDKYGYIDYQGNIIISPEFMWASAFEEGRAVVNASDSFSNKIGLIDNKGNFIISPIYNDINLLGQGRVAIGKAIDEEKPYMGSVYAIGDIEGNLLTEFSYFDVSNFNNGLASVSNGEKTFFIDTNGKVQEDLPIVNGEGTLTLDGNIIKGYIDLRTFYLSKDGDVIWSQNTIIPLNNQYEVVEVKYKPNKDYLVYYPQIEGMESKAAEDNVNENLKELSAIKPIESDTQLEYSYSGDFSVEFFKENLLVLNLNGYEYYFGAAHGMPSDVYAHINLLTGDIYELKDLFKEESNYVKVLSDIVGQQIKNMGENSYIFTDTYKGIRTDQPFYVDEDELNIYFQPYEIAAFAAGFPTFKIPFSEIVDIINIEGDFWKSFHS